jgi:hypothetical protein
MLAGTRRKCLDDPRAAVFHRFHCLGAFLPISEVLSNEILDRSDQRGADRVELIGSRNGLLGALQFLVIW